MSLRFRAPWILVFALGHSLAVSVGGALLPELPQLNIANFLPAIRQQIEVAYAEAQTNPNSAEASGRLAMILDAYQQYESAAVCYQRAHLLDRGAFRWLYYLGWTQSAEGKHEEAAATLREALRLNPEYLAAQLKLAEGLLADGNREPSRDLYEAILKKHPDSAAAHYGLGRVYATQGDLKAAAASYLKACELFPAYGAAHYALALAYRKLGETVKARQHFSLYEENKTTVPPLDDPLRSAVRDLDLSAQSHLRKALVLDQTGKIEAAIAEHEKALQIDPQEVQAHINLISLYGRLGQFEKAEQHFRAAINLHPNRADAYYDYGVLLISQRKDLEAERALRQALQINPFYAEAYNNLGYLYEQQGRLEEALQQYREAIENRPNYRLAHFHIGRILVNQGRYNEAIEHFLKTLAPEDASTPGYLYALAATYARAGDRESALRYAHKAREGAVARGQTQLLRSIDRDLRILERADTRQ